MDIANKRIISFAPVICKGCRLLILGTMPGQASLARQMYYANERNHFWDFIYRIFQDGYSPNEPFDHSIDKDERYSLLLSKEMGVWDIISSCTREGSSDKNIKNEQYNDVKGLVRELNIKVVVCNGKEAYRYLKKSGQLKALNCEIILLNSTSSLNPNNTFRVFKEWLECFKLYL